MTRSRMKIGLEEFLSAYGVLGVLAASLLACEAGISFREVNKSSLNRSALLLSLVSGFARSKLPPRSAPRRGRMHSEEELVPLNANFVAAA